MSEYKTRKSKRREEQYENMRNRKANIRDEQCQQKDHIRESNIIKKRREERTREEQTREENRREIQDNRESKEYQRG